MQRAEYKEVSVWGVNVRYVQAGVGPPVLLIHGLGTSLITWYCNVDAVADAGYTVFALDLPGHGESDKPSHLDYDPASAAEFVFDFTEVLGLKRIAVVGSSAGGLVAGLLAVEHPERVTKLALAAPGGMGRGLAWGLRLVSIPLIGDLVYRPWLFKKVGFTRRIFYRPPEVLEELLPEMYRMRELPGARAAMLRSIRSGINFRGLRDKSNILERLPEISVPFMTVWGQEDIIIPISHAQAVKRALPESVVHIVPECGHWPQMEKPELFNRLLTDFLSQSPEAEATSPNPAAPSPGV